MELIRNFCIIAHIHHGKSTLADRLLERTDAIPSRNMKDQILDSLDLERERGITIKSHAIQINYPARDGKEYHLNLIDTPGHVDFSYEVSRSLAACEGALLLVDAAQGIEAQTISNLYLAMENDLTIIPVINKIDLVSAQTERIKHQLVELLGVSQEEILLTSAKFGHGIDEILEAIIKRIPPPKGDTKDSLKALIFDSVFDSYRGVIAYIRVVDGSLPLRSKIKFFSTGKEFEVDEVGILRLQKIKLSGLSTGEVGYIIPGAKNLEDVRVGDTITSVEQPAAEPLPGYKEAKPMVFAGLYPSNAESYEELKSSLARLALNDSAIHYEQEASEALGFGFRCGFLGLLHKEIIQERLEREYGLDIITTIPNVVHRVILTNGEEVFVDNPVKLPPRSRIDHIEEPYVKAQILTPSDYIGNIMKLSQERRGKFVSTEYLDERSAIIHYRFPLSEIVFDFYDKLKSISRGLASFDYEYDGFQESKVVKLDILINGNSVDALSLIVHQEKAYEWGRKLCRRLRELIPRQLYEVVIQAAIGSKIIAREGIKPLRKNVTAKCYGGDVTRKRKLIEKQKEGKKRMKQVGKIEIPQEAFLAVLKME